MLDEQENLKLTAFGSAHSISESEISSATAGTYAYMAPEVFGQDIRFRARPLDIWAAGVTLY